MKVSYSNNIINSYLSNTNKSPKFNNTLNKDVFVKSCSFKGNKCDVNNIDEKSFSEFEKWCNNTNFLEQVEEIVERTGRILGSGFEGETYEIPNNDNWVIKKYKRGNFFQIPNEKHKIVEVKDISPELNIGQTIARVEIPHGNRFSYVYYILKKQTGKSCGIPFEFADQITPNFVNEHIKYLQAISNCPDSTFEKCIQDTAYITKQGYEIDCCNPYNLMFNTDKQRINFVDINDKLKGNNTQFGNVLFALLDGHFGINFAESDYSEELQNKSQELSDKIIQKFIKAMDKAGTKFTNGTYFDKLVQSSLLDNTLAANSIDEKYKALKAKGLM